MNALKNHVNPEGRKNESVLEEDKASKAICVRAATQASRLKAKGR
jgi:hypothetical protein